MNIVPKAPLFCDPIYNGAADPVVIWNSQENAWWMFYTNRRAYGLNIGFSFMHGTDIGIASSTDGGLSWLYRGTAQGLCYEPGRNTYWAPEIIEHEGVYHMYVSYVKGIPQNYDCGRDILHYTSRDLWNWTFESKLNLSSDRVIDACVIRLPDGHFKMWYKDERHGSNSFSAYSDDLYTWTVGEAEITGYRHEGPNVFFFENKYWMIIDKWQGLDVYVSDDAQHWTYNTTILDDIGIREDDGTIGAHADILVHKSRAYIFYFTHPGMTKEQRIDKSLYWEYEHRRSSIQVAELKVKDDILVCDRDHVEIDLAW